MKFHWLQLVRKKSGYEFPGIFLAYIRKTDGSYTCAVEHRQSRGMVHLFAESQLEEDASK